MTDPVTELVLQLWRRGYGIQPSGKGQRVRITGLGTDRLEPSMEAAILTCKPGLLRRMKKPPGWPRGVPLPPWWLELAPAFRILKATRQQCEACRYPVAVQWDSPTGPRWCCPRCGRPIAKKPRGKEPNAVDERTQNC